LYFRFSLSFRDVDEMMAERGVVVSYETIQEWNRDPSRLCRLLISVRAARAFAKIPISQPFQA